MTPSLGIEPGPHHRWEASAPTNTQPLLSCRKTYYTYLAIRKFNGQTTSACLFICDELCRRKIKDNSVDLHKMAHFATHIPWTNFPSAASLLAQHSTCSAIHWITSPGKTELKERKIWRPLLVLKVSGSFFIVTERPFSFFKWSLLTDWGSSLFCFMTNFCIYTIYIYE